MSDDTSSHVRVSHLYDELLLTFGLGRSGESARISTIKNGALDQYGAEPFEQQQFGTAGVEGVKQGPYRTVLAALKLQHRVICLKKWIKLTQPSR